MRPAGEGSEVLHGGGARAGVDEGEPRQRPRSHVEGHGEGAGPHRRRAGVRAARPGRRAPPLPGPGRLLREAEPRDHHQHRVLQMGRRVRRRQDGAGADRQDHAPRKARRVQRREQENGARPHAGKEHGLGSGKTEGRRSCRKCRNQDAEFVDDVLTIHTLC